MGKVEYISEKTNIKEVLEYLKEEDNLTVKEFIQFFKYLQSKLINNDVTIDDKCLLSVYLLQTDIDVSDEKNHGCNGIKTALIEYYMYNFSECLAETKEKIIDYICRINQEKFIKVEQEVIDKYPEMHDELEKYKKAKELKKIKKLG